MKKETKANYKPAYIEQVILWMVIFIAFVWMLFFVIDYATALRIKDNMDDLSKYGAKYVARYVNQVDVDSDVQFMTNLNNLISVDLINDVDTDDLTCVIDFANTNSQSIFTVQGVYKVSDRIPTSNFDSTSVVYNNTAQENITCTLNLTIN